MLEKAQDKYKQCKAQVKRLLETVRTYEHTFESMNRHLGVKVPLSSDHGDLYD
jgi:hypothetical protein